MMLSEHSSEGIAHDIEDSPPQLDRLGPYDEKHLQTYLRLLDAEAEGADWREVSEIIFGLNPDAEPDRAKRGA